MRKVLIVCPNFAPSNAADSHRCRLLLPHLKDHNWNAEVLSIDPKFVSAPQDEWLLRTVPKEVRIHRTKAPGLIGGWPAVLDFRATRPLRRLGNKVLASSHFDLILFSTTVFGVVKLGREWSRRFGIPFIIDFQDPWVTSFYRDNRICPPGGWLKYSLVHWYSVWQQRLALQACRGLIAVSKDYVKDLESQCKRVSSLPYLIERFPGSRSDIEFLREKPVTQTRVVKNDGVTNWVYAGVCGPLMYKSLKAFLIAVRQLLGNRPELRKCLKIHFIGTSYAENGRGVKSVEPIARELGIAEVVTETTDRLSYSMALQCLQDADALIMLGTNDPTYTASKLYPYLLMKKPLLAVFRKESSVCTIINEVGGGVCIPFSEKEDSEEISANIYDCFVSDEPFLGAKNLNEEAFQKYTDSAAAERLCRFFDEVVLG